MRTPRPAADFSGLELDAMMVALLGGAACLLAPAALHAQLGSTNPAPGPRGTYAITNARIVPVSGRLVREIKKLPRAARIEAPRL